MGSDTDQSQTGNSSKKQLQKSLKKPSTKKEPKKQQKKESKRQQKKQPRKKNKEDDKKKKQKSKPKSPNKNKTNIDLWDYLYKQNRPYNLLNIFDNLHGVIKKSQLEKFLDQLVQQKKLVCKQFGKNKVYMVNQQLFNIDGQQIQKIGSKLSESRQICSQLKQQHKAIYDQYRNLIAKKTINQLNQEFNKLQITIKTLEQKKQRLTSEGSQKVDKQIVQAIEKQQKDLRKQVSKRKKITKECLGIWSQVLEKKIPQVAQIMGVQL